MVARIIQGDCLDVMREMEPASVDAIVTDPPYGLNFMARDWDHGVPGERYWIEALRVAKPGAHLLAFGGTRTYHRLTCAIEDAGWEIRDCLGWIYGSGFPKSKGCLKPAWEPIVLARKPAPAPALNIDACRVAYESDADKEGAQALHDLRMKGIRLGVMGKPGDGASLMAAVSGDSRTGDPRPQPPLGRWPANILHDGSDEVLGIFPQTSSNSGTPFNRNKKSGTAAYGDFAGVPSNGYYGDAGSAARFFYCAKASRSERGEGNVHPTVKPLALMRYLCRLITPPGGLVLDPFAGSGSTLIAAVAEGFEAVGIEREAAYAEIARQRFGPLDQFAEATS